MKILSSCLVAFLFALISFQLEAQAAKDQVVPLRADADESAITLRWETSDDFTGSYTIFKRQEVGEEWQEIATVNQSVSTYEDTDIMPGEGYEYRILKMANNQLRAFGYLYAGYKKEANINPGQVLLVVDHLVADSLSSEIGTLMTDLRASGWNPRMTSTFDSSTVLTVKDSIKKHYDASNAELTSVFIIGHVPVPYSGNYTRFGTPPPDGHIEGSGNHTGAWAADAFYGDIDGEIGSDWTDNTANHTDARQERGNNVPNDGKFDQSKLPTEVELAVGRVDMHDMPSFSKTEIQLLRDYLKRNHEYRIGKWKAVDRALIDNNFGVFNLASTGYHNLSTVFEKDSIFEIDYVSSQREKSFLWSYGCGAGYFTHCDGLFNGRARTSDIAADTLRNVFTMLAGSYFGDWDVRDNFLRAPLANRSLISFWGGLPKWYVHHISLGDDIGKGTLITQNNTNDYFNGQFNSSENSIHIALMGDPTLQMYYPGQASNLQALSQNRSVELTWNSAEHGDFDGYFVYRVDTGGVVRRLTDEPLTDTSYIDETNWFTGSYSYEVRPVKLRTTAAGSYYNIGGGSRANVEHVNNLDGISSVELSIYPNPSHGMLRINSSVGGQLRIINMAGNVLANHSIEQGSQDLNLQDLTSGVYFLMLESEFGSVRKKLVKF